MNEQNEATSLLALARSREAQAHRLPNGLGLWLRARLQAHDGLSGESIVAMPASAGRPIAALAPASGVPSTATSPASATTPLRDAAPAPRLHDANRQLIASTLAACNGNITRAARRLGVSRGLLYRRLKETAAE